MQVANVINTEGVDISRLINEAAAANGLAPTHLLALIMAESGRTPNPKALRFGTRSEEAKECLRVLGVL
jgi:hypothetical protein